MEETLKKGCWEILILKFLARKWTCLEPLFFKSWQPHEKAKQQQKHHCFSKKVCFRGKGNLLMHEQSFVLEKEKIIQQKKKGKSTKNVLKLSLSLNEVTKTPPEAAKVFSLDILRFMQIADCYARFLAIVK